MVERADQHHVIRRVSKRILKSSGLALQAETVLRDLQVGEFIQGNFTVVTLTGKLSGSDRVIAVGVAKRNPEDGLVDPIIGYNQALIRAYTSATRKLFLVA